MVSLVLTASILSLSIPVWEGARAEGGGEDPKNATARLEPRSGSSTAGSARFQSAGAKGGVKVHLVLEGATPGEHGVHLHEKGDCSDPKAASAGGHFNPGASPHHGAAHGAVRHGGDLGNVKVGKDGKGVLDVVVKGVSIAGDTDGILGRSLVVHEKADDLHTDPSGDSGGRVACGVVAAAPGGRHTVP